MSVHQHIRWHIGCSGFYYKEWKDEFYPKGLPQKKWFDYYTQHFNTLEINNTFYRFPTLTLFENWYAKAPAAFCFSVKVPRTITHLQKFNNTQAILNEFYAVSREGLKDKLGAVLFQLPPQSQYSETLLQTIVAQLDPVYKNAIEFRHNSWWRPEVFAALEKAGICFCGVSYPGLLNDAVAHSRFAYYRFHGVPKLYHSAYSESFIGQVSLQLASSPIAEAFVYFNNTASGAAIDNARFLQMLVATEH